MGKGQHEVNLMAPQNGYNTENRSLWENCQIVSKMDEKHQKTTSVVTTVLSRRAFVGFKIGLGAIVYGSFLGAMETMFFR